MKSGEHLQLCLHGCRLVTEHGGGVSYFVLSFFSSVLMKPVLNIQTNKCSRVISAVNQSIEVKYAYSEMHKPLFSASDKSVQVNTPV